ncbi:hypothetical protein HPG69_007776 [Diceros bicornis minor]|uniref:Uncharacterized protein n=1 Tax=Diceros bicornis minor TaxID=77932 RepID=A0A7J7EBK4_DICBM|nr:hypothetical protein HPG69_007776 [Diceros bicornis minor]
MCHQHPQVGGPGPLFTPASSTVQRNISKLPITALQLICQNTSSPCCAYQGSSRCYSLTFDLYGFWALPTIFLLTFDTSKPFRSNTTHWCPAFHLYRDGNQHNPPQNRCTLWQGSFPDRWRVYYVMGKAMLAASPSQPLNPGYVGGLLSPRCQGTPPWASSVSTWFDSSTPCQAGALPGYLFLCGPRQNMLPHANSPTPTFQLLGQALAYPCIDNA